VRDVQPQVLAGEVRQVDQDLNRDALLADRPGLVLALRSALPPGQSVQLKARALPFGQLRATVDRIAPVAEAPDPKEGKLQSTVPVYCRLTEPAPAVLRPGMTGFARISCGQRGMGRVLADKALRYVRTEFWW
jgi:hypothetical protein